MGKRRFTQDSWRKEPWFRSLVSALVGSKTEADMENFLRDVGTLAELQAWSERFEVAKQLAQGKTYREISLATGASTTTVTRVAQFLENGEGGYRKALNAHRHHRMVSRQHPLAEALQSHAEGKPVSVLQKYLEKAKENS